MAFATSRGVLFYDGETWQIFKHPRQVKCNAVEVDRLGRFLVGFDDDFGVIRCPSDGAIEYRSLVPEFLKAERSQACIQIEIDANKVYFGCTNGLFLWSDEAGSKSAAFISIASKEIATAFWLIRDTMFASVAQEDNHISIRALRDDAFVETISSADDQIENCFVVGGCEFPNQGQILASYDRGLWLSNGEHVSPFPGEVNEMAKRWLVKGIAVYGDVFVLAAEKGVIFFDGNGRVTDSISTEELPDFGVCRNRPFLDHENQMWIPREALVLRFEST